MDKGAHKLKIGLKHENDHYKNLILKLKLIEHERDSKRGSIQTHPTKIVGKILISPPELSPKCPISTYILIYFN